MMDIGFIRGAGTVIVFVAFIGVVLFAYSSKRKNSFDDAANLPFADDKPVSDSRDEHASRSKTE